MKLSTNARCATTAEAADHPAYQAGAPDRRARHFAPFLRRVNADVMQTKMNEKQRAVAGTFAIALIVAALFYIPWRVESAGDLKLAPFTAIP